MSYKINFCIFRFYCIYWFVWSYACLHIHMYVYIHHHRVHVCVGQKTACRNWSSPSTVWIQWTELRLSGLVVRALSYQLSHLISPGSLFLTLGFCWLYDSWTFCPLRNRSLSFLDHPLWDIKLSISNDVQEGLFCCLWSQQDSIANPNHAVVFFKNVLVLILIVRSLIHLSFTFAYVVR